jgi:predicted phage-related endonuclease
VSGLEVADVVVSFAGTMPVIYTVEADPEIHALLVEKESEFWAMVENQTPPEPVTFSDMVARFKSSTASIVTADLVTEGLVERLRIVRTAMKELEKEEEEVKAQLMKAMGEHDTLADVEGKVLVTWKQGGPTKRFDTKDFQSAQSELYTEYLKEGDPIRRFLLK